MPKLTSKQLTELGDNFLAFTQAVGNYRITNRKLLSDMQNQQFREKHHRLLRYADDFYIASAISIAGELKESLITIKEISNDMKQTYQNLKIVQKAIDVATAGIAIGKAIFTQDAPNIISSISELVNVWNASYE